MTSNFQGGMRSQYFAKQYAKNRIVRDLQEGLTALRGIPDIVGTQKAETPYLKKFPNEPEEFYQLRVSRTFLTNYFMRAITSDSGKILANNVILSVDDKPNDSMPEPFRSWTQDVTLDGDNLTMFTQSQLQNAMKKGVTLTMVDYSSDELSGRPFLREIDIDSVIDFKSNPKTGKLTYLKFYFDYIKDGSDFTDIHQSVFELTPTKWKIFDANETDVADEGEIKRYLDGKKRITDEIPVSIFYTNKKGVLRGESPYQTLAELTVEHFQVYSDIKNMMFYALTPILAAKNVPNDFSVQMLASYMMVKMPESGDQKPELEWVQVDSGAIQEGQKQLEGIQQRIATFTIDNNAMRPGTLTATQTSIESQGSNAALRSFAVSLSEHIREVMEIMVTYTLGSSSEIKAYIAPEFNSQETDKEMRLIMEMRRNQDVSRETVVNAAIQRKLLPPDFNIEENWEQIEEEMKREVKYAEAQERIKAKLNKAQQASDGLLSGNGREEVTDKARDA